MGVHYVISKRFVKRRNYHIGFQHWVGERESGQCVFSSAASQTGQSTNRAEHKFPLHLTGEQRREKVQFHFPCHLSFVLDLSITNLNFKIWGVASLEGCSLSLYKALALISGITQTRYTWGPVQREGEGE